MQTTSFANRQPDPAFQASETDIFTPDLCSKASLAAIRFIRLATKPIQERRSDNMIIPFSRWYSEIEVRRSTRLFDPNRIIESDKLYLCVALF